MTINFDPLPNTNVLNFDLEGLEGIIARFPMIYCCCQQTHVLKPMCCLYLRYLHISRKNIYDHPYRIYNWC